jgi:hypothetical protein
MADRLPRKAMSADAPIRKAIGSDAVAESGKLKPAKAPGILEEDKAKKVVLEVQEEFEGEEFEIPIAKAETGVMLAFMPDEDTATGLAIDGGEPAEALHLTLAYLGKVKDLPKGFLKKTLKTLATVAKDQAPLSGNVAGLGRFTASETSDGKDVLVALADVPGLGAFRHNVVEAVTSVGIEVSTKHDFTPHITLAYLSPGDKSPIDRLDFRPLAWDQVALVIGDEHYIMQLGSGEVIEEPEPAPEEAGDEEEARFNFVANIVKANKKEQIVTGVVLQPETVDAHGDIIGKDVIKDAAHAFLSDYNQRTKLGLQHSDFTKNFKLVESYLAPTNMVLNGRKIKEGSWIMSVKILDQSVWAKVEKGEVTGFSIGGVARVRRLAAVA